MPSQQGSTQIGSFAWQHRSTAIPEPLQVAQIGSSGFWRFSLIAKLDISASAIPSSRMVEDCRSLSFSSSSMAELFSLMEFSALKVSIDGRATADRFVQVPSVGPLGVPLQTWPRPNASHLALQSS